MGKLSIEEKTKLTGACDDAKDFVLKLIGEPGNVNPLVVATILAELAARIYTTAAGTKFAAERMYEHADELATREERRK